MDNYFETHQAALRKRVWTWEDIPFYRRGDRLDTAPWHKLDYLDLYEKIYGRRIGGIGTGKLREVALTKITDAENQVYDEHYPYQKYVQLLGANGLSRIADINLCREQQELYADLLLAEGVTVHWIDWGDYPVGPFGPLEGMRSPQVLVVNGGAIVPKMGWNALRVGQAEWLSQWLFWNLNLPTLATISGKGIMEPGAVLWLAEGVLAVGLSPACNEEGLEQLLSVIQLTTRARDVEILRVRCQGGLYFDKRTGASAHLVNVMAPLGSGKVLCHPPGVDTETLRWLKSHDYMIIEPDFGEQISHFACSAELLEPGHVVLPVEAPITAERVRKAGIDVLQVPYSAFHSAGGGFRSSTIEICRDPVPTTDSENANAIQN